MQKRRAKTAETRKTCGFLQKTAITHKRKRQISAKFQPPWCCKNQLRVALLLLSQPAQISES